MATKKYLSLERLTEYDELIKGVINSGDESTLSSSKSYTNTEIAKITNGTTVVSKAETATNAENLGGQAPSYYAKASDIPTGALANKSIVSESDLDSALAEKVNAAAEGNHSHSNKTVLDGITSAKVTAWDNSEANSKEYTDEEILKITSGTVTVKNAEHATKADSADKAGSADVLATGRKITLGGDASGSVTFDGSQDVTLTVTVADDSHAHTIANVDGLQDALNAKSDSTHNHDNAYDAKGAADTALSSANTYTDGKIAELLNNSSEAVDSIYELRDAMEDNADAIEALQSIAAGKANATHSHAMADVTGLDTALAGKAEKTHGHAISEITDLETTLSDVASAIGANTTSISGHTDRIVALEDKVGDGLTEITSEEINALFV